MCGRLCSSRVRGRCCSSVSGPCWLIRLQFRIRHGLNCSRSAVNLLLIVGCLTPFVRGEAAAAEEGVVRVAWRGDEAVAVDDFEEAGGVLLRHLAANGCGS